MHPRSLLLVTLFSHQVSASWLLECCRGKKKAPAMTVEAFLDAAGSKSGSEPDTAEEAPLTASHAKPSDSHPEPQTTTTSTHPHEAASQDLQPDYGLANDLIREFSDHSRMRPDVYQGILDSLLKGDSASTLKLILDFDKMVLLAAKGSTPYMRSSQQYLSESRENVRERLYEPIVGYLISDEFVAKAQAADHRDLVEVLEWELPLPLLKRAVKESNCSRVAEILAWYKDYLACFVNGDGYPLNVSPFDLDPTFLRGCEDIIFHCTEPVILDEFFKYPYFAWKVADMLHEAVRHRHAKFAEYLVSKLSEEYHAKSNPSLAKKYDLAPAACMYRESLQGAFINACHFGLPQIVAALAKLGEMDVEGGFAQAVFGGHVNVLFVLFRTCGAAKIPNQKKLLASLNSFSLDVWSEFSKTYFPYPPVPDHFASIEAFVQFLKERIDLIESNIASCGGYVRPRRGRGGRPAIQPADISTDKKMKKHFEAVLRAIVAASLLQGPFLLAVANSYGF